MICIGAIQSVANGNCTKGATTSDKRFREADFSFVSNWLQNRKDARVAL